jgi:multidrug resistance efflux pump
MLKRILLGVVVVSALTSVLVFSQLRDSPRKVSGFIEADEIRLGSRIGGRVAEVLTEEGAQVRKGQVLVKLEPFDLLELEQEATGALAARQADLNRFTAGFRPEEVLQAKARYDQFAAQLDRLTNGPREEEIAAARGRSDAAAAEFMLAEQNYARASKLLQNSAVARQELENAEQKLKSARSMVVVRTNELQILEVGTRKEVLAEAQAKLEEAKAAWDLVKVGYRAEEINQATAARDSAKATLAAIRQRLEELQILSPVDGVVEALELQQGDLVAAGAPVLSLMDTSHLWVRAYVPENELGLTIGQVLPLSVDSYPGERFRGELSFIARQAEFTPSNVQTPEERSKQVFRIKVNIVEGLDRLRPGMSADVWLDADAQ